jgi:glycosyltransferase involved in cell wall biosynthesis
MKNNTPHKSPTNIRVSLVIPAHNEEKYIEDCLEHVLRNSADFFEIIVIDNASTDGTRSVVEKVSQKLASTAGTGAGKIRIVHEPKKGLVMARQRGFAEAKGDIIAYVDADTRMPEGWLDAVVHEFSANPNLACLSGPYIYHDIPRWQQSLIKLMYWRILAMPVYYLVGYMATGANFAIRKSVLEKMGGFDTTIAFYGEDTNIARRAAQHGKMKFKLTFVMYLSGRRLKSQGITKTGFIYIANYISEVLFKKPASKTYKDFR